MAEAADETGPEIDTPIQGADGASIAFPLSKSEANWGVGLIGGVALALLAGAFWFAWRNGTGFPWGEVVSVAVGFLPVLGIMVWMFQRARVDRSAHLIISVKGIFAPNAAARLVPWEALDKVTFHETRNKGVRQNVFMALHTAEPDRFGAKGNSWSRRMRRWWYDTDIVFALEALVGEPEDVIAAVKHFAPSDLLARSGLDAR